MIACFSHEKAKYTSSLTHYRDANENSVREIIRCIIESFVMRILAVTKKKKMITSMHVCSLQAKHLAETITNSSSVGKNMILRNPKWETSGNEIGVSWLEQR